MTTIYDLLSAIHVATCNVATKKQPKVTAVYSTPGSRKDLRFFSWNRNLIKSEKNKNFVCSHKLATLRIQYGKGPQNGEKCYTIFEHVLTQTLCIIKHN